MALNFPNNPSNGQTWTDTSNGITYMFDGLKWLSFGGVNEEQGELLLENIPSILTVNYNTTSLADLAIEEFTLTLGQISILTTVVLSHESWVRLYRSSAQRAADTRTVPGGTFQDMIDLGDNKPYAEIVSTEPTQTIILNPPPTILGNGSGVIYGKIQNQSAGTATINTSYTVLKLKS